LAAAEAATAAAQADKEAAAAAADTAQAAAAAAAEDAETLRADASERTKRFVALNKTFKANEAALKSELAQVGCKWRHWSAA